MAAGEDNLNSDEFDGSAAPPIDRREFELKHAYPLDREFPDVFKKICGLPPLRNWIEMNGRDELQIRLGKLIYVHRNRYADMAYDRLAAHGSDVPIRFRKPKKFKRDNKTPTDEVPYFNRIYEAVAAMQDALVALNLVAERLPFVDITHIEEISELAEAISEGRVQGLDAWNLHVRLRELMGFLAVLTESTQLATGVSLARKRRGQHGSYFIWSTSALVGLWEDLSGSTVRIPKSTDKGIGTAEEFVYPSAEFVRLGLTLIHPTITGSAVIGALRNHKRVRKGLPSIAATQELLTALHERLGRAQDPRP